MTSYVYWATPASGSQTGVRGFASDSSGIICYNADGSEAGTTGNIGSTLRATTASSSPELIGHLS